MSAYSPLPSSRGTNVTATATEGTTKGCRSISGLRNTDGIRRGRVRASSASRTANADQGGEVPDQGSAENRNPGPRRRHDERQGQVGEDLAVHPDGGGNVGHGPDERCDQPGARGVVQEEVVQGEAGHRDQCQAGSGERDGGGPEPRGLRCRSSPPA